MAYGIKMYNKYGKLNIDETSKAIRIHDEGTATVPAGSTTAPGNLVVEIKPISYLGIVTITDIHTIFPVAAADLGIEGSFTGTFNSDNQIHQILIQNSSLNARLVKWRIWGHI
jgi:hypothetical protein